MSTSSSQPTLLALIPARGGSKGLPGKNHKILAGKPLVDWTIEQALTSKSVTTTVLSSDDHNVLSLAKKYPQCHNIVRPENLADDESPMVEVSKHALSTIIEQYDYLILLQPTSPLRVAADIDRAFQQLLKNKTSSCVSVCEISESPYWMYTLEDNKFLHPVIPNEQYTRRQDLPKAYKLNGAIYIIDTHVFKREYTFLRQDTQAYIMPKERSIDIDSLYDFQQCETYLSNRLKWVTP